jgi:MoCo/4Fe-4S cofactor protein with predicted Tat translocation signal
MNSKAAEGAGLPDQMPAHRSKAVPIDLEAVRSQLPQSGAHVWRSLDEVAGTPEFQQYLHREFPTNAAEWLDPVGRRSFLKLMSASMALAGVTACTVQPQELIVPYVRQPEEEIPGKPLFFATAITQGGVATGLLVESHEGRPTKIEGNPDHPASKGATDLFAQGSVLTLYDPDRSKTILQLGEIRPWSAAMAAIRGGLLAQSSSKGAGLRILTETVASPTLAAQIQLVLAQHPNAKWIQWEPVNRDNARAGARAAFDQYLEPLYDLSKADVIVSLDADFLSSDGAHNLNYMRQFAARRRVEGSADNLNRLYVVESDYTVTGGKADHRLALKSSQIEGFARTVAAGAGVSGVSGAAPAGSDAFASAVAKDLAEHKGRAVVIAGDSQPPAVHALAHAINAAIGAPVSYVATPEIVPTEQNAAFAELVSDMYADRVQMLVIVGESNPAHTAPADLKFAEALQHKVSLVVHSGLFVDETATLSHWHIPAAHYLEAWSDARTIDGTVSIVQPLIQPLYGGKSAHEVIATLTEKPERNGYDVVREYWQTNDPNGDARAASERRAAAAKTTTPASPASPAAAFEKSWRKWLHDGFMAGSAAIVATPTVAADVAARVPQAGTAIDGIEVNFRRDPTIYDGRYANNGWLQELPKPMSKLTWDTAAHISPAMAAERELHNGDVIAIQQDGRSIHAPVFVMPGHAKDSITITVGYGRKYAGRLGSGLGVNAYELRGSSSLFFGAATITSTGDDYDLAITQEHWAIEGRNLIRSATLEEFKKNPAFVREMEHGKEGRRISLYRDKEYRGQQWGMAIDMNACTGCMACVVACVAENNIPVVGKVQVKTNREMHWLRIDRYFAGNPEAPDVYMQPLPCQQCENAPCEVVCPVAATAHSAEGLNDMVYNRCVGTRYCSNNCPWKVRRFNFLLYQDWNTPQFKLQRNPDVTVRSRGVMEKCNYCVQRINAARIQSKREDRDIRDGEIVTACQAVCPTEAIIFGNINDPNSRVAKLKASPRNYTMLEDLNTRPRTTYLAAVKNPNPALGNQNPMVGGGHDGTHTSTSEPGGHQ